MNTVEDRNTLVTAEEAEALELEGMAVAPEETIDLLKRWNELTIEESRIKAEKATIKELVMPYFAKLNAKALTFAGRVVVALGTQVRKELDTKRLAADYPEINLNDYFNTKKSVRFDVKKL